MDGRPTSRSANTARGPASLAAAILDGLGVAAPEFVAGLRYEAIEINEHRRAEQARRLHRTDDGPTIEALDPVVAAVRANRSQAAGVVIAHEFLDASPVHRVEWREGELRELFVDWADGGLVDCPGPPSTPRLAERLRDEGVELAEGQRAEIAFGVDGWLGEVAGGWAAA